MEWFQVKDCKGSVDYLKQREEGPKGWPIEASLKKNFVMWANF